LQNMPSPKLKQIRRRIKDTAKAQGVTPSVTVHKAKTYARKLPLSHGFGLNVIEPVLDAGRLISQSRLPRRKSPLNVQTTEEWLGTSDYVFLYVGNFRYPKVLAGFLLKSDFHSCDESDRVVVSPFDTGALHRHLYVKSPDASAARKILEERSFNYVEGRHLLGIELRHNYLHENHYIECTAPHVELPCRQDFDNKSADNRKHAYEVRVLDELDINGSALAFFVPRNDYFRLQSRIEALKTQGVEVHLTDGSFPNLHHRATQWLITHVN